MARRLASRFLPFFHALRLSEMAGVIEVDGAPRCGRSYCCTLVVSRDADYLQHEFTSSSRELVPTSSKVGRDDLVVSRPNWKSDYEIGKNVPRKDKIHFLINLMLDLKDSREAVYGALDAWVAWEQTFPLVSLKKALLSLEKDQQWHRVIQIIKWMLSKGQGTTMGTYEQLIRALEKDDRAEEAHRFWEKRIGHDFHSAPWQLCSLMISIYYRNNMLQRLVKLFKCLEDFNRKPPDKTIVQKVANAYELLGLLDEKYRILEKFKDLFHESERKTKKSKQGANKKKKKEAEDKEADILAGKGRQHATWESSVSESES